MDKWMKEGGQECMNDEESSGGRDLKWDKPCTAFLNKE